MKKILLFILILTIVQNCIFGQKVSKNTKSDFQENSLMIVENDTFALVKLSDIDKSYKAMVQRNIYKAYSDSLELEINKLNSIINGQQNRYYTQLKRDSLQTKVWNIKVLQYNSLQKSYKKLKFAKKLKGSIGGGLTTLYNLDKKVVNNIAISLNAGVLLNQKHFTTLQVGLSLNRDVLIGLNYNVVF